MHSTSDSLSNKSSFGAYEVDFNEDEIDIQHIEGDKEGKNRQNGKNFSLFASFALLFSPTLY
jgi:hypothetical protein